MSQEEKPFNYMTFDDDEEAKRRVEYEHEVDVAKAKLRDRAMQEENLEKILKNQKNQAVKHSQEQYKAKHREFLDIESQPIRIYLQNNVAEILAQGLAKICKEQPEDPVDALAEFLFKNALNVNDPHPFAYK